MRHRGRSEEQLASCCLQIPISGEHHPLSGIFHFPEVSLTSVTNQEAWKWPMKAAMAPKDVPVCSQLKLVQAETSRRDAGRVAATRAATALVSELRGLQGISGGPSSGLAVTQRGWRSDTLHRAEPAPEPRGGCSCSCCTAAGSLHLSRELSLHIRPQPAPEAASSPSAWQPDLAPCLAMASQRPRDFCLIPSGRLAWKLAGCKHFCHCSKAWDFSFPAKWLGFSARLGEALIAPARGHTANGS